MITSVRHEKRFCLYKMKTLSMHPDKVNRSTNIYYATLKQYFYRWKCLEEVKKEINEKLQPFSKIEGQPAPDPNMYGIHVGLMEHMIERFMQHQIKNLSFKITYVDDILKRERY